MPQSLRQLTFTLEGRLCDAKTKETVSGEAFPCSPANAEVDVRELNKMDPDYEGKYLDRIHQAVVGRFPIGHANAYVYGASGRSYAEGYVWVPIQFYKVR